jgi:hypothetical protein
MEGNTGLANYSGGNKGNVFYNTIGATGEELKKFQRQTEAQADKILALFEYYPNEEMTKHEIKTHLVRLGKMHERTPESSINRALTGLMNDGKILKLDKMRMGEFDKPNHLWKLKNTLPIETQTEIF